MTHVELIKRGWPWKGFEDLKIASAEGVVWFATAVRDCDDLTPVEAERAHYRHHQTPVTAAVVDR